MTLMPTLPAATEMDRTAGVSEISWAAGWEWPEPATEEATAPLRVRNERASHPPNAIGNAPHANPRR